MRMVTRIATLLALAALLTGCITTSSGGMPDPASEQSRVKARLDLARGYINARSWGDAKRALLKALEIDSRSVESHVLLALVYEAEGEVGVAEDYYKKALRIDRANAQALNNYGTFLARRARPEEAIEKLQQVVQNTDYHARPQAYENLGLAELAMGNREAAEAAFERALSLNPMLPVSALELSALAYDDGRLPRALSYYEDYKRLARQNPRSLCLGMKLGVATGDADQVASYGLALKNLYSDSEEARACQATTQ